MIGGVIVSLEQNDSRSVIIKNNNGVTGVIEMITVTDNKQKENFKRWADDCAKQVKVCDHTFKETEQYLFENCDVLPLALDDRRMKYFQLSVIVNYCEDRLEHKPPNFPVDMTDKEIENWQKGQDAMKEEALNSTPEHFGLTIRGYYLPQTENNSIFYEQAHKKLEEVTNPKEESILKHTEHSLKQTSQIVQQDICFFFEETTEHYQFLNCGDYQIQKFIVFKGVTQNDIEKQSPRFLVYIKTLQDMGRLPAFSKE